MKTKNVRKECKASKNY